MTLFFNFFFLPNSYARENTDFDYVTILSFFFFIILSQFVIHTLRRSRRTINISKRIVRQTSQLYRII